MPTQHIRDKHNRLIAYIEDGHKGEQIIRDRHRRRLGFINKNGTYDAHGHRLSPQAVPGLLITVGED